MLIGHTVADSEGRLLAVDPTICEILQRSTRELVGLSYAALTHPQDRMRNVTLVDRLDVADGPARIRKRYLRPDGSMIWADVQVSRLETDGVGRLIGTIALADPTAGAPGPDRLWRAARSAVATIQRRRARLGDDLFADHAWLVLLQLYLAEAEGRLIAIAGIAERADIRAVLVERWILALDQKRLIDRLDSPDCAAQLTPGGIARIESLLTGDDAA